MRRANPFATILLLLVACAATAPLSPAALTGCATARPTPPHVASDAGVYTPVGTWVERVGRVIDLLRPADRRPGGLDGAIAVVTIFPMDAADRAEALRYLAQVRDTLLPDLAAARDGYLRGDPDARCRANAAAKAIALALRGFGVAIARSMHWDVSEEIRFALNLVGPLADELTPSCEADAGWAHTGNDVQAALAARASPLRRFPTEAEAREAASRGSGR